MNNDIKKFPIKDFNFSFVDTETTGPDLRHELTEIGLIKVSGYNFSVLEEWEAKIKPKHIELADPEALKMNHYKEEDWRDALELETAMKIFWRKPPTLF